MHTALETWAALLAPEHASLRALAAACDPGDVSAVAKLRKKHPAELVHAALQLAEARRKLERKWPGREFVADPVGAEMASGELAARHKAGRFAAECAETPVFDLCCGIGADAVALIEAGLTVTAVDVDPLRAWMAGVNAACESRALDVQSLELADETMFHLDPSRRDEHGRRIRYDQLTPGPSYIEQVCEGRSGAVKLPPGINPGEPPEGELEYISERGRLTQAVLWTGRFTRHAVSATLLRDGVEAVRIAGETEPDAAIPYAALEEGMWAHTVDPSVERAGLLAPMCRRAGLAMPHPQAGLLVGEAQSAEAMLTPFKVLAEMPWRRSRVLDWMRAHDGGLVEVKTRGKAVDPDVEQMALRGEGGTAHTVFVLRFGEAVRAVVCER
ncbi:MAG: hypothetical protein H6810_08210 [Phycisphaeraceae bacterium]|nr:MAG: hypothetical protein H6810_08210 [Phycisphaeraceae bacterium]